MPRAAEDFAWETGDVKQATMKGMDVKGRSRLQPKQILMAAESGLVEASRFADSPTKHYPI